MNNTFTNEQTERAVCFHQFRNLDTGTQQILRSCAAQTLVLNGADEVGSSDVTWMLFTMWRAANRDWMQAILAQVDAMAPDDQDARETDDGDRPTCGTISGYRMVNGMYQEDFGY